MDTVKLANSFYTHEYWCSSESGLNERTDHNRWKSSGVSSSLPDGLVDSAKRMTAGGRPVRVIEKVYNERALGSFETLSIVWQPPQNDYRSTPIDRITITITRMGDEFFTNAVYGDNFICTARQPSVDMSIASAMEWIREQAAQIPGGEYFLDEDDAL